MTSYCSHSYRGIRVPWQSTYTFSFSKACEVKTVAYNQIDVFKAAELFVKTEGIVPAPEPAHAIKAVIDEAIKCKERNEEKAIVFLLCTHGHFDMRAYEDFLKGKLPPFEYPKEK